MRKAYNGMDFLRDDKENIMGINLGYDYCAEHEWGIKRLQEDFGLKFEEELGFEARRNTKTPKMRYIKKESSVALIYAPDYYEASLENLLKGELALEGERELATAWDESSFGVNVISKHGEILRTLRDAFQNKNGIIMLSGNTNPFSNSGLLLVDYSKIPEETKNDFRKEDKEYRDKQAMFRKMEQESGVYDLLKESGKDFFALHITKLGVNGQPVWLLNPCDQRSCKWGFYTTEQLRQWARNEGPVLAARE